MYTWWVRCKYTIIVNQTEAKNMRVLYLNQKRETDREKLTKKRVYGDGWSQTKSMLPAETRQFDARNGPQLKPEATLAEMAVR
jgi:hypothetical protein